MGSASRAVAAAEVTFQGVTKKQRQIVAMICAQTTAINGFGSKFTFFAGTGDVKATIIHKPFFSVVAKKEELMVANSNQGHKAAKEAEANDVNFTFKEKQATGGATPAQPNVTAAAQPKEHLNLGRRSTAGAHFAMTPRSQVAHAQPKPNKATPKVDKNVLSARTDGAGARRSVERERSATPSPDSDRASSGSAESIVAMETSFPPLSLPARKEPRGPLPGQADGKAAVPLPAHFPTRASRASNPFGPGSPPYDHDQLKRK